MSAERTLTKLMRRSSNGKERDLERSPSALKSVLRMTLAGAMVVARSGVGLDYMLRSLELMA